MAEKEDLQPSSEEVNNQGYENFQNTNQNQEFFDASKIQKGPPLKAIPRTPAKNMASTLPKKPGIAAGKLPSGLANIGAKGLKGKGKPGMPSPLGKPGVKGGKKGSASGSEDMDPQELEQQKKKEEGQQAKSEVKTLVDKTLGKTPTPQGKLAAFAAKKVIDAVDDEKAGEVVGGVKQKIEAAGKLDKTLKKKMALKIIAPALPYIFAFLGGLLIMIVVAAQIMFVRDRILEVWTGVTTGLERALNFAEGRGWNTNEEAFFNTLEREFERSLTYYNVPLDIPLIAATVHYSKISDITVHEDFDQSEDKYGTSEVTQDATDNFGDFMAGAVPGDGTKNFYAVANIKLGSVSNLWPGQKRLIGHLVATDIQWVNACFLEGVSGWVSFFEQLLREGFYLWYNTTSTTLNYSNPVATLRSMRAFANMGPQHVDYPTWEMLNMWYEVRDFLGLIDHGEAGYYGQNIENNIPDGIEDRIEEAESLSSNTEYEEYDEQGNCIFTLRYPRIVRRMDYDAYRSYLEYVYLPLTYCWGGFFQPYTCTDLEIKQMADEIFDQREYYRYLVGDIDGILTGSGGINRCGGDNCNYDIARLGEVSNIHIRLYNCRADGGVVSSLANGPILGEDLIPLEQYILGVVYAELESSPGNPGGAAMVEAWKAQAVAARGYTLNRAQVMGRPIEQVDGMTIIPMLNCVGDQVFCNPELGCSRTGTSSWLTHYSGLNAGVVYKRPLNNDLLREAVASTGGQVLIDASGNIVSTGYVSTDQRNWASNSAAGMNYEDILISWYTNKLGISLTLHQADCATTFGAGCASNGAFVNWKQNDPRWGNDSLGTTGATIGSHGCAAVSVAIVIAKSGIPTPGFDDFNPGTFVAAGMRNGLFSANGSINFDMVNRVVPGFNLHARYDLTGTVAERKAQIARYESEGCFMVVQVKRGVSGCQHWVAIDTVRNNEIFVHDPAGANSGNTLPDRGSPCGSGDWETANRVMCYKVGG